MFETFLHPFVLLKTRCGQSYDKSLYFMTTILVLKTKLSLNYLSVTMLAEKIMQPVVSVHLFLLTFELTEL